MPTPSQTWTRAWSDNGYGVTVFLPDDAKVTPLAQNPEIAKFDLGQDIFVTMMISQMEQVMPLRAICVQATRDASCTASFAAAALQVRRGWVSAVRFSATTCMRASDAVNSREIMLVEGKSRHGVSSR